MTNYNSTVLQIISEHIYMSITLTPNSCLRKLSVMEWLRKKPAMRAGDILLPGCEQVMKSPLSGERAC